MSDIGPWNLQDPSAQGGDMIMRMMARNSMSEKLAEDIDRAVKELSDKAYEQAKLQIKQNRFVASECLLTLLESSSEILRGLK